MKHLWLAFLLTVGASAYANVTGFTPNPLPGDDQSSKNLDPYCELIESNPTVVEFVSKRRELKEWESWAMGVDRTGKMKVKGKGQQQYTELSRVPFDTAEQLLENWVVEKVDSFESPDYRLLDEQLAGVISYCAFKHRDSDFRFLYFGQRQRSISEYDFVSWIKKVENELAKIGAPKRSIDDEGNIVETVGKATVGDWIGYPTWTQMAGLGGYRDHILPTAIILGGSKVLDNVGDLVLPAYREAIAYYENARLEKEGVAEALAEAEKTRQLKEERAAEARAQEEAELKQKLVSGQLEPTSISEAVLKWSAENARGIVATPPLEADKKYYRLWGRLELVNGNNSYTFRQMQTNFTYGGNLSRGGAPKDFFVGNLARDALVTNAIRANSEYQMVGQFVDTVESKLVSGETVYMAVFRVVFME